MVPECMEVYLRWSLELFLENLNTLKPLQDLPSFNEKIRFKVIKNLSNDKSLEVNDAISHKKLSFMIFDKKNDWKWNERKS